MVTVSLGSVAQGLTQHGHELLLLLPVAPLPWPVL